MPKQSDTAQNQHENTPKQTIKQPAPDQYFERFSFLANPQTSTYNYYISLHNYTNLNSAKFARRGQYSIITPRVLAVTGKPYYYTFNWRHLICSRSINSLFQHSITLLINYRTLAIYIIDYGLFTALPTISI